MANRTKTHLHALLFPLALAGLGVTAAPAGCGGSNTGYGAFANPDGGGATYDATNGTSSGNSSTGGGSSNGASNEDGSQGTCPQTCTQDSDCQSTCPAAPNGGVNCCDTLSG